MRILYNVARTQSNGANATSSTSSSWLTCFSYNGNDAIQHEWDEDASSAQPMDFEGDFDDNLDETIDVDPSPSSERTQISSLNCGMSEMLPEWNAQAVELLLEGRHDDALAQWDECLNEAHRLQAKWQREECYKGGFPASDGMPQDACEARLNVCENDSRPSPFGSTQLPQTSSRARHQEISNEGDKRTTKYPWVSAVAIEDALDGIGDFQPWNMPEIMITTDAFSNTDRHPKESIIPSNILDHCSNEHFEHEKDKVMGVNVFFRVFLVNFETINSRDSLHIFIATVQYNIGLVYQSLGLAGGDLIWLSAALRFYQRAQHTLAQPCHCPCHHHPHPDCVHISDPSHPCHSPTISPFTNGHGEQPPTGTILERLVPTLHLALCNNLEHLWMCFGYIPGVREMQFQMVQHGVEWVVYNRLDRHQHRQQRYDRQHYLSTYETSDGLNHSNAQESSYPDDIGSGNDGYYYSSLDGEEDEIFHFFLQSVTRIISGVRTKCAGSDMCTIQLFGRSPAPAA